MKIKITAVAVIVGAAIGYFVLSPFAMYISHVVHMDMPLHEMKIWEVFKPGLILWALSFTIFGSAVGLIIGLLYQGVRESAEEIKEAKEYTDLVVDSMSNGVVTIDRDYRIVSANRAFIKTSGFSTNQVMGKHCYEVSHGTTEPCNTSHHSCPFREVLETGRPSTAVHTHFDRDGNEIYVELIASPVKDEDGNVIQMIELTRDITERKKVEEELMLFSKAVEEAADAINIINREGKFIFVNPEFCRMHGYTAKELIGESFLITVPEKDRGIATRYLKDAISEQRAPKNFEGESVCKDGSTIEVQGKWSHIYKDGKVSGTMAIIRDITERKKSEQQIRDIINAAPDVIHVISPDMRIIKRNTASEVIFPHIKEGDHCYAALHGRDEACPHCGVTKVFKSGEKEAHESTIKLPDGNQVTVYSTSSPMFDEKGNITAVVEILRDITKRKKVEEELKLFSKAVEEAADAINIISRDGKFIFVNPEFCRMHGYTPEEIIGESFLITVPPENREVAMIYFKEAINERRGPVAFEGKSVCKDGSTIEVQGKWSHIYKDGKVSGTMAIIRDITERKRAENELKKHAEELEEANRLKELFNDIMVHDLLNPAGAIKTATELMRDEAKGAGKKLLDIIEWGAKKQIDMIESASRLSKLESVEKLEKQNMDLNEVIARAVEDTRHLFEEAGMRTENKVTKPMPVKANPMIEDVFFNLLSNAAKYAVDSEKAVIDALNGEEGYTVMVKDYGLGIPNKDKEDIFERFTRKEKRGVKGSGLGLTIAKRVVDLHGGKVWVEDNPEGGSIFYVNLPK